METAQRQSASDREAAPDTVATDVPGVVGSARCFLCVYSSIPCQTPSIEGELLRVSARGVSGQPAILLATSDGEQVGVLLNDYARSLVKALLALPPHRWRGLHVRVYHLLPLTIRPAARLPQSPDATTTTPPADVADDTGTDDDTDAAINDAGESRADRWLRATPESAVVLEPDLLLNITDINNAEYCVRQYPLRRMVPSAPTLATLRGVAIHAAFKELLKSGRAAPDEIAAHRDQALHSQALDLALRQIPPDTLAAEVDPHLHALAQWYSGRRNTLWSQGEAPHIRAETFLLAPEVGLKGRLDFFLRNAEGEALLELKTGQARGELPKSAHRWQVFGYQTLLSVRDPQQHMQGAQDDMQDGAQDSRKPRATLLYSATPGQAEAYIVPFQLRDLHRVLALRNLLALTHATGAVPAPPGGAKCFRCSLRPDCGEASTLLGWEAPPDEAPGTPQHPDDAAWFARMYELLRLEQRAAEEQSRALWRLPAEQRRRLGIALGDLTPLGEPRQTPSGEWEYSFRCENTSELREGDAILLSDGDPVSGQIVSGSILRLEQHGVTVWAPERIAHPALIDRYGSDIVHDRTVRNLWRWLDVDPHLRGLVAGRIAPTFATDPAPDELADLPATFNPEQRQAVAQAVAARDFLLVQGPPGTGKTSVVAEIARRALARGERVLLAAFTNQAVDNALRRIVAGGCENVVRLGHSLSVAPDLRPYRLTDLTSPDTAPQRMRERLLHAGVVAATTATWSAEHYDDTGEPLRFDLAIVDEATQITTPALLGALRFARRFVLVGDERQLPPLVMSEDAARRGLKHSLFAELLARWGDSASVALQRQYRMRPEICAFPSETFYGGALRADGAARTATLAIAWAPTLPLAPILDPARPMLFVDTPSDPAHPEPAGKVSAIQAEAACKIVMELRAADVPPDEIGVIAPFRAQVAAIRQRLAMRGETRVVVDTVDRFQGAERDVILFSFGGLAPGASADMHMHGQDFLADPQRLNVALTRARRKLILIGDRRALEAHPLLHRLIQYCGSLYDGRGGVITARFAR